MDSRTKCAQQTLMVMAANVFYKKLELCNVAQSNHSLDHYKSEVQREKSQSLPIMNKEESKRDQPTNYFACKN